MTALEAEAIGAWLDRLPPDVRSAFPRGSEDVDPAAAARVAAGLAAAGGIESILSLVESIQDSFVSLGRAGRVRFLAWFASLTYPDRAEAFRVLLDEGSEGDSGGFGKIAPVFLEDVRALMAALGPRAARGIVDGETLGAVAGAGFEVASDMDMPQGGAR